MKSPRGPGVILGMITRRHLLASGLAFAALGGTPARADEAFGARLGQAALDRLAFRVTYDPAYVRIPYPMGDVPPEKGVCADEVIRAYRTLGIDLQREVHEDMRAAFHLYPRNWGLKAPDSNIDHRRVPNLERFFTRKGKSLPLSTDGAEYRPGELVTWRLGGRLPHIGIVTPRMTLDGTRPLIEHNIGAGPMLEDVLFAFPMAGHFRYWPQRA